MGVLPFILGVNVMADSQTIFVEIQTTLGTMEAELYADQTPTTVGNFVTLTKEGFYNNRPRS